MGTHLPICRSVGIAGVQVKKKSVSENPLRGDGLFALSCIDGRAWPKLHLLATAALIEFKVTSGADAPRVFDSFFFLASGLGGVMLLLAPPEGQSQAVGQQT